MSAVRGEERGSCDCLLGMQCDIRRRFPANTRSSLLLLLFLQQEIL